MLTQSEPSPPLSFELHHKICQRLDGRKTEMKHRCWLNSFVFSSFFPPLVFHSCLSKKPALESLLSFSPTQAKSEGLCFISLGQNQNPHRQLILLPAMSQHQKVQMNRMCSEISSTKLNVILNAKFLWTYHTIHFRIYLLIAPADCACQIMNQVLLTSFVDPWVVTELQHIEVAPLHAFPDAVDVSDVGAFALHCKQGSHHVLVSVMLEVGAQRREPHQPQQESAEPGNSPPLQHGPLKNTKVWNTEEGGKGGCPETTQNTRFSDVCSYMPNISLTALFLFPLLLLLSHCLLPHRPLSEEQARTAPLLLLCLTLLLQQLLLFHSIPLWVLVKYMLLALLVLLNA